MAWEPFGVARYAGGAAIALAYVGLAGPAQAQQTCPQPVASITSSQPPVDVNPGGCTLPSGNPIAFFDDFSWKSFVALIWPALKGVRGTPDPTGSPFTVGVPLVLETYKADWESFPNPTSNPPTPIPTPASIA